MEVLLRRPVEKLGQAGDLVNVRPGYARNYLLPQGLAVAVTKENARLIEQERAALIEAEKARVKELEEAAKKLADVSVTIAAKASPEGHLYGSVNAAQIAEALQAQGFDVAPKAVQLEEPIKQLDVYDVPVRLHAELEASVKVWVVSDSEDAPSKSDEPDAEPTDEPTE